MLSTHLITPKAISLLDITSMGDSSKRGDSSKIGQFDSGLKYAIALLLRNDVLLTIRSCSKGVVTDYSFSTTESVCESTGKKKELIVVHSTVAGVKQPAIVTGFSKQLGYNWELWMAYRELYSNMLDEGGEVVPAGLIGKYFNKSDDSTTCVSLHYEANSEFATIIENKGKYFLDSSTLLEKTRRFEVHSNPSSHLTIYKNSILVYEDENVPSKYRYNIFFGTIDERRILSEVYAVGSSIHDAIYSDIDIMPLFVLTEENAFDEKDFINKYSYYAEASAEMSNLVETMWQVNDGKISTLKSIMEAVRRRADCSLPGRVIKSVGDHVYSYSSDVKIENMAPISAQPTSLKELIEASYNFKVQCEVKVGSIFGSQAIADKFNNCIIVNESFDVDQDMPEFIVQYVDLTQKGNILKNLSVMIANLIKK